MLRIDKILAPVDLSGTSGATLRCAGSFASSLASSVTVLYVGGNSADARHKVEALMAAEMAGIPASTELKDGDPAGVIVETARSGGYGMIVMATHGRSAFQRLLLGSVTTRVLDETDCPVCTGVHMEHPVTGKHMAFDNIVCAVD